VTTNFDRNPYGATLRTPEQIEKTYQAAHDPERAAQSEDNIVIGAWGTAFVIPIVGFVLGTILTARQRETHGIGAMIVSTIMTLVWWAVLASIRH
jgi:hypothetical protein